MAGAGTGAAPLSGGVLNSVRSFLASWIAVIKTRIEIVSVEVEEQREWLEQLLFLAIATLFCLSMGLILFTLFVVVLFWDKHPLAVLGAFTIIYFAAGLGLLFTLRHKVKTKPRLFASTTAQLDKDYAAMQPGNP